MSINEFVHKILFTDKVLIDLYKAANGGDFKADYDADLVDAWLAGQITDTALRFHNGKSLDECLHYLHYKIFAGICFEKIKDSLIGYYFLDEVENKPIHFVDPRSQRRSLDGWYFFDRESGDPDERILFKLEAAEFSDIWSNNNKKDLFLDWPIIVSVADPKLGLVVKNYATHKLKEINKSFIMKCINERTK